jgi:hypothetical protein
LTNSEVFIIESLTFGDETHRREGEILSRILGMADKSAAYWYIRTKAELRRVLQKFGQSGKRYLHISCHGNPTSLCTTLDEVPFSDFAQLARPYLAGRRLFISACEATNTAFVKAILPNSGCHSVIGPVGAVEFGDAAIMWAAFYHLMFKLDDQAMNRRNLEAVLTKTSATFGVGMRYYRLSHGGIERLVFRAT